MEETSLHAIVERVMQNAQETLLKDGHHIPLLLLFGEEKSAIVALSIPLGEAGDERSAIFRGVGTTLGESYGPHLGPLVATVHISEAWGRMMAPGEVRTYWHMENDPQRQEVLIVAGYSPTTDETVMHLFDMQRDADGTLVAAVPQELPDHDGIRAYLLEAFCEGYAAACAASRS